jgi:hypothetical protein
LPFHRVSFAKLAAVVVDLSGFAVDVNYETRANEWPRMIFSGVVAGVAPNNIADEISFVGP